MAVSSVTYNKPVLPRTSDGSDLGSNRASIYSGKALSFDGVNDVVTIHEATDLWTGDFSVSWYGNLDAVGNNFAFSSGIYHGSVQAGINVWYGGASALNFSVHFPESDGTGQQGYNLLLAESYLYWHRIDLVFVSSSRLLSLYQNGILVDTATIASNVDAAYMPNGWEFGRSYGGSYPLDGKLTNLKAFSTALTAAQVKELYDNPEQAVPTGVDATSLVLHLPMTEGAGSYVYNANAGAIGTELISNAGFDETCQKWGTTDSSTVEISGGKAIWTNPPSAGSFVEQPLDLEVGKFYRVSFDYNATIYGLINLGNTQEATLAGSGRWTVDMYYGGGDSSLSFQFGWATNSSATIDNVSVKEVVPTSYKGTINGATWLKNQPEPLPQTALMNWNQGTNRFDYTDFGNAYWTKNGVTVTGTNIDKPFSGDVYKVANTAVTAYHNLYHPVMNVTGNNMYYSLFAKAGSVDTLAFIEVATSPYPTVQFNLTTGDITETIGSAWDDYSMTNLGNGWFFLTAKYIGTTSKVHYNLIPKAGDTDGSYAGSTSEYMYLSNPSFSRFKNVFIPTYGDDVIAPVLITEGITPGKDIFGLSILNSRASGSYNFDGDSYASVPDNSTLYNGNSFTVEAWIYPSSNQTGTNRIINKWDTGYPQRTFQFSRTAKSVYLYISNGSNALYASASSAITYNSWNHVVGTYDGDTIRVYTDALEVASFATGSYTLKDSTQPILIGAYGNLEETYDKIAHPRVYNYALTAQQVADNFNEKASTFGGTKVASELDAYIERTASDGATVEAHSCLVNYLTELDKK